MYVYACMRVCMCIRYFYIYICKILYNNIVKIHGLLIYYLYVALTRGQNYKNESVQSMSKEGRGDKHSIRMNTKERRKKRCKRE